MKSYIYFETYGCSANQNNSEIMKGLVKQAGYEITSNEKIADIIIINSCVVKGKTENKIKRRIQDLSKSGKLVIVSGCIAETDYKKIKKLTPKSIFLGTHHIKDIVKLIKDHSLNNLNNKKQEDYLSDRLEEKLVLPKIPENNLISIIQISEGCLGECTYCKTRLAKGKLSSYNPDLIIKSIENDLSSGAKEIWLTSQDCASYGLEKGSYLLPTLLKRIISLKGNFKIRLGMSNPNNLYPILDELLEIYDSSKIYKFLHLPIQSASDKVLLDMKRPYKISKVYEIIKKFRKKYPNITIATDIITGYPTESDLDHKLNLDFIKEYKPDVFNLSKFSSHKGTMAEKLPILPIKVINKRTTELMELHRKTSQENKQIFQNKDIKVFVNKKTLVPNIYESRDENYNIVLVSSKDKSILGKSVQVKIKNIGVHHMIGEFS
ncbi:MAG: tRNA (N(6)-L-threonylcarbamoyladenosine(37)-C(2))-methylthiotransferase [Candidatus Pacearchaeota archaeon]|jgi:MiaB-like tRNA modifying enzyme